MKTNKNKAVPRLRFPEFQGDEGWSYKKLGKITNISKTRNSNEKVKRVFTNSAEYGIVDQQEYFKKDIANQSNLSNYYIVDSDDFIYNPRISILAPVGPISRNTVGKGVMSPLYTVFSFNKGKAEFYEKYFNTSHWHRYLKLVSNMGARHDRMNVSRNDFLAMPLPYPKLDEQQKIADCLSSLDDLINAENEQLDTLKEYKAGLLKQLFPAEGETTPKRRFAEFADDRDWEEVSLAQICEMKAGTFIPASEIQDSSKNDLYPCYGGNGLRGFTKTYTHNGLFPLVGRQGALCGNVNLVEGWFHATEHALVCAPKPNIDVIWLYYQLVLLDLNKYATGQAQPGLSVKNLNDISLRSPINIQEQQKIADCLSSLDNLIQAKDEKIEALKHHKQGLMQQLFPINITLK